MSAEQVFEFHLFSVTEKHCKFFVQVIHAFQLFAFGQPCDFSCCIWLFSLCRCLCNEVRNLTGSIICCWYDSQLSSLIFSTNLAFRLNNSSPRSAREPCFARVFPGLQYHHYALSKARRCLRHNLCSQSYGSKSLQQDLRYEISSYWRFNV
jgi:hypothetical protein